MAPKKGKTPGRPVDSDADCPNKGLLRFYSEIVRNMKEGVVMVDARTQKILYTNPEFTRLLGYKDGELVGSPVSALNFSASKRPEETAREIIINLRKSGTWRGDIQNRKKDGSPTWTRASVTTFKHPDLGQVFVSIHQDITERKKSEEDIQFRAALLDNANDAIHVMDADGNIVYCNETMARHTGYSREELVGMNISKLSSGAPPFARPKKKGVFADGPIDTRFETLVIRKDGTSFPAELHARALKAGDRRLILSIGRDITERRKAEEDIRFRVALLDNANDGILALEKDGTILYCNETISRQSGYAREELLGRHISILNPSPKTPHSQEQIKKIRDGGAAQFDAKVIRKDGGFLYYEIHARSFTLGDRKVILAIKRDITERRKADEDIRFRAALLDNTNDWIHALDPDGRIIYCNDTMCRETGYSRKELLGKDISMLTPQLPAGLSRTRVKEIFSKGSLEFQTAVRGKNGRVCHLEVHAKPLELEGRKIVIAIDRDISDRKRMETALKDSEANFRNIFNSALDGLLVTDIKTTRFVMCNHKICEMLGYSAYELQGLSIRDIHRAQDLPHVLEQFNKQLRGEVTVSPDMPVKRKDGGIFYADISSAPITFGRQKYLIGNFRDVTERRRTELALKRSETLHRTLIDTTDTGYVVIDSKGYVIDANEKYLSFTGYSRLDEIYGRSVLDWTAKHDLKKNEKAVAECAKNGFVRNFEVDYADSSGGITPIEVNATVVEIDGKPQILTLCRDISDRRKVVETLNNSLTELAEQKKLLEQKNIAFQEVIKSIELEKSAIKDSVAKNVSELVLPILKRLKITGASRKYLDLLQKNLAALTASFGREITEKARRLTPREIEICNMIKEGLTSKEIAGLIGASSQTVDKHRKNIRKKLGLNVKKSNLVSFLRSFQ